MSKNYPVSSVISRELKDLLEKRMREEDKSQSKIIRAALELYLKKTKYMVDLTR